MTYGQELVHLVDATYASRHKEGLRTHLGASVIGESCLRAVWYGWRWVAREEFEGRMLRLFAHGDSEEGRFSDLLRAVGATVWTADKNGKQFRVSAFGGHFGGSLDGVAVGLPNLGSTPILLEFKTHNDKSFKKLLASGVQVSKLRHYRQAQVYMGLMGLSQCLYCAVNKNDEELYFELFKWDPQVTQFMMARAQTVIFADTPPPKISNSPAWFECRFCAMRGVCHAGGAPKQSCRTCQHARPSVDGQWLCRANRTEIQLQPELGCSQYQKLGSL